MKLTIETGPGNPILRTLCKEVSTGEIPKLKNTFKAIITYLKNPKNQGIGMAAPQIGITKRFCVCGDVQERGEDKSSIRWICMINPVITSSSDETDDMEEGCLSLPDEHGEILIAGYVRRPLHIEVSYTNEKGQKMKRSFSGFNARVVQHEIDHLDGVLYTDKLIDPKEVRHPDE